MNPNRNARAPRSSRDLFDTLGQAKDDVRRLRYEGTRCPCCDQHVKVYRRRITTTMAAALVRFARASRSEGPAFPFLDVTTVFTGRNVHRIGGDFAKLRHWGLVEQEVREREPHEGPNVGRWRLTALGYEFVYRNVHVNKYVWLFQGAQTTPPQGDSSCMALCNIREALGTRFSYDDLMRGRPDQ